MYFDIHSHILHNTDDGAKNLNISHSLLSESFSQGVTDIIATPHFYPFDTVFEDYTAKAEKSFKELKDSIQDKDMPNIYLGYEVLYYNGIGRAESLKKLTLNGSKYILIEPDYNTLEKSFYTDLFRIRENGMIPIIAHIERYYRLFGYKKLLNFVKENNILTQVNATSFFNKHYNDVLSRLTADNLITVIASDTHSLHTRPPMIDEALRKVKAMCGEEYAQQIINNSQELLLKITTKEADI